MLQVVFCRLADATSAVEQFDQQLIEGRRVSVVLGDFEEVESSEPVASTSAPRYINNKRCLLACLNRR